MISESEMFHIPLSEARDLTSCLVILWGLIGLAYPLYNAFLPIYLSRNVGTSETTVNETYR
jgi:hypothetical protein